MIKEKNDSLYIKCFGKQANVFKYFHGWRNDKFVTKCKKSCTTVEYTSELLRQFQYKNYDSGLIIRIDSEVTEWESSFKETPLSVLEALGSSLGLWLGLGIIQVTEQMGKLLNKIKERFMAWKKEKNEVILVTHIKDSEK